MPKYTVSVTNNSITLNVSGEDTSKTVQYYEYACKYPHQTGADYVEHNNSQSSEYTFRGLESGALYTVNAKIHYKDGTSEGFIGGRTVVVGEFEGKASIVASDVGSNSCSVKLTELSVDYSGTERTAYWIFWELNKKVAEHLGTVTLMNGNLESGITEISGLNPNTEYHIYAMVFNSEGFLVTVEADETITTSGSTHDDTEVVIDIVQVRDTDITIVVKSGWTSGTAIDGGVLGRYTAYIRNQKTGETISGNYYFGYPSEDSPPVHTYYNLIPGVTYEVYITVWGDYGAPENDKYSNKLIITTISNRPEKFLWTYEKREGEPIILSAQEWNELTQNINAVRKYKQCDEYQFTFVKGESNGYSASQSDKISAGVYNEAVEAIRGIDGYETYLSYVEANNPAYYISADRLNALVSEINAIP